MPWLKGVSGNPKGRPRKGGAMTDELRRILALKDETGIPLSYAIAYHLGLIAVKGDVEAIKYVFDRVDGKPIEQPADSTSEKGPVIVNINGMPVNGPHDQPRSAPEAK